MKKIFLIALFLVPVLLFSQNTIRDKYNYIQVNIGTTDSTIILKSSIEKVKLYYGNIYIISNSVANNNAVYGYYLLKPSDYPQFATANAMYDFIKKAASNGYTEQYFYTGARIDSVRYSINGTRQFGKHFSYTGTNLTGQIIVY